MNDALRGLIRYRGALSKMAIEALTTVDLATAGLVSAEEKMVREQRSLCRSHFIGR